MPERASSGEPGGPKATGTSASRQPAMAYRGTSTAGRPLHAVTRACLINCRGV